MRWRLGLAVAPMLMAAGAPMLMAAGAPPVVVTQGWSRATYGAGATAVGYLTVTNHGGRPDRLIGAACRGAASTTLHRTEAGMTMGGMSMDRMAAQDGVDIPAGGSVTFAPGGLHLMLMNVGRQLIPGDQVACTLHFAVAGNVEARLLVQLPGDTIAASPR